MEGCNERKGQGAKTYRGEMLTRNSQFIPRIREVLLVLYHRDLPARTPRTCALPPDSCHAPVTMLSCVTIRIASLSMQKCYDVIGISNFNAPPVLPSQKLRFKKKRLPLRKGGGRGVGVDGKCLVRNCLASGCGYVCE